MYFQPKALRLRGFSSGATKLLSQFKTNVEGGLFPLTQGSATYGPRAGSGPRPPARPARGWYRQLTLYSGPRCLQKSKIILTKSERCKHCTNIFRYIYFTSFQAPLAIITSYLHKPATFELLTFDL